MEEAPKPKPFDTLVERLAELNLLDEEELNILMESDRTGSYELLMGMAAFITKSCGNMNKIYEKTTQLTLPVDTVHVKHEYGTDLWVGDVATEVKTSVVTRGKMFKSNWMFTITLVNNQIPIFEQINTKYTGNIILNAIHGSEVLKNYTLSGLFFALYATKCCKKTHGPLIINLGSSYCEKHKTYHRIDKYIRYDLLLQVRQVKVFSLDEWQDILARTICR